MAARRVNLMDLADPGEVIAEAARLVAAGHLVVFPTETVYGLAANADDEAAIARLYEAKDRPPRKPLTIHLAEAGDAAAYTGPLHGRVRRLMARGWPGPLTLVVDRLPEAPGRFGTGQETVGLRVPHHEVAREVLRRAGCAVAATSANLAGHAAPTTGDQVMENVGDRVALVLDGGPTRYGRGSTVVRATADGIEVLRQGVVSERQVGEMASFRIAFICSGNTCRSPMAEAILRHHLARRLKVPTADLLAVGFSVYSAGTGAVHGVPASDWARATMRERGYDVGDHFSQPITLAALAETDLIFTMTESQRAAVAETSPEAGARVLRLDPQADVVDPVGGSAGLFAECADQIEAAILGRMDQILEAAAE